MPGRRHRVGHERDAAGRGGERDADDLGMQVHAVGDHLERHARVGCRRGDRTRVAVVQAGHRVERVREDRGAGVERGFGLGEVRAGVPDGRGGAGRDDEPDRVERTGQLGRQRHLADGAAPGVEQALDRGRLRRAQQRLVVRALVVRVEERSLEVRAEDVGVGRDEVGDHRRAPLEGRRAARSRAR